MRRPIRANDLVAVPSVAPPPFVVAGEPVRFEWRSGDVEVSVMGIALNSARRGEQVRARLEERPGAADRHRHGAGHRRARRGGTR
ncbi:MAG: flagella basal body P-ring formation protein FlgA [Candidatus Eisenbacteria bacterium]|nr:flagella basal body P-ring formation protein FlgA [Candidatus Eisenbacteria bacterium]